MTSNNSSNRLDRIEALLESIAQRLEETRAVAYANGKSIEAFSNERKQVERELNRDRARLYQTMADLASAQAGFYGRLAEVDQRQDELSRRQGEIVEILQRITQQPPQ
ncbi:hypothetical protein [Myxosarcina sp. GI1(2024)]